MGEGETTPEMGGFANGHRRSQRERRHAWRQRNHRRGTTLGTGSGTVAFLAPAAGGKKQLTLTLQNSLTFNSDATYTCTFKAKQNKSRTDLVVANGVGINGATIDLVGQTQGSLRRGLTLTVISNTSANPISGSFSNLPNGEIVTINGNNFQASYSGGDGNDLTLTVVP